MRHLRFPLRFGLRSPLRLALRLTGGGWRLASVAATPNRRRPASTTEVDVRV